MIYITKKTKTKNKNMIWTKKVVGKSTKKLRKRYLTKARKLKRLKWIIILAVSLMAGVIIYFYTQYCFNEILLNLDDSGSIVASHQLLDKNAPEAQIEANTSVPQASVKSVEQQIRDIAKEHNFKWIDYLVRLADCESKLNPLAVNDKNNNPSWSKDRGLFQYNSHWQSGVSDECAFDIRCSTEKAIDMINSGKQRLWVCNDLVLAKK